jgi:hypothetical protein
MVRFGKTEISKELARHTVVIMLPGMNQLEGDVRIVSKRPKQRGYFHEVRARTGDADTLMLMP